MKDKLSNSNGFSLIEVIIAMVTVTIGMFAIMSLIMMTIKGNVHSKKSTIATTLAQDKIEKIKTSDFDDVSNDQGTKIEDYGAIDGYIAHKRVTTIYTNTPAIDMITGSVTVHWIPGTHSVNLSTIVSK